MVDTATQVLWLISYFDMAATDTYPMIITRGAIRSRC